ncbi:DUF1566 domain-containing protein, partial [bacterium]|nr:DUF1566 domain-containing protein [bacterium]
DFYAVRGRIDSGTDLVAAGVSSGTTVSIFQASSTGGAFPGYDEIDSETFDANECRAVTAGLSLHCRDTASGSSLRLRGTRARPGSWRVIASVRGRDFDPGKPFGTPLAAEVDLGSAGGAFLGVTATCRLSNNGDRYTCNGEGVAPTPTPTPTSTPIPTPTPCVPFSVDNGKSGTYTDNCNGTVTDSTTGLVWEKKTDDGGVHDKDNTYTWTAVLASPYPFDGTAKAEFLDQLNCQGAYTSGCTPWLGQNWRLPTIVELAGQEAFGFAIGGIVDLTISGCGAPPYSATCINSIFGPTVSSGYWSSSTYRDLPVYAWIVVFGFGDGHFDFKTNGSYVRAVRGGS